MQENKACAAGNGQHNSGLNVSFALDRNRVCQVHPTNLECTQASANWQIATQGIASLASLASSCPSGNSIESGHLQKKESRKSFFLQSCLPFIMAGCGMLAAGILLDKANSWLFLSSVPEALILVPALLGLKGNLEMTLASRLSTMANLGLMNSPRQQLTALYSNVSLVQAQAIVVALIASLLAVGTHLIEGNEFDFARSFCVILSATVTASVASFALASIMVLLAIIARHFGLNPDNIATPIAAALGDVTSLAFLIIFGTLFYRVRESALPWLIALLAILLVTALIWMLIAARVALTRQVLKYGWFAVLAAMCISSGGGYVLRHAIRFFPGIALFQPIINGVGGNLVAVQASKISTYLHQFGKVGCLPANRLITYVSPYRAFACKERESCNAVILLLMSVPGHIVFIALLILSGQVGTTALNVPFLSIYICTAIIQITILLYTCQLLCRVLWLLNWNPDNNAIPLLTALGDLLGTSLLAFAFLLHVRLFPEYAQQEINDDVNGTLWSNDAFADDPDLNATIIVTQFE